MQATQSASIHPPTTYRSESRGEVYPPKEGSTFDLDYYLKTHLPIASKHWKPRGLQSCKATKVQDDAPYTYGLTMAWESMEGFAKSLQTEGTKEIIDDIKNYSSVQPIFVSGEVVGTGWLTMGKGEGVAGIVHD